MPLKLIPTLIICFCVALYSNGQITYVKPAATGTGSSWANASGDLRVTLNSASSGDTIWVAAGTYKPTTGTNRNISFQIPDNVKVFGGFAGNEASNYDLDLRDFTTNETILSGNIGTQNDNADNAYHVVNTKNVSSETVVNGFTITEGNANNVAFPNSSGGGWLNDGSGRGNSSNPTLINCIFTSNSASFGGAMINDGYFGNSNPTLVNCTFASNTASSRGGAMYNFGDLGTSNPILTNCTFTSNTANNYGGAMYNEGIEGISNPTLTNCTFVSNTANNYGGAMYNSGVDGTSNPTLTNCILWDNKVGTSPNSFYNDNATVTISYSLVEEADCNALDVGDGNVVCSAGNMIYNQNPQFINVSDPAGADNVLGTADDGLRLQNSSPAKNAGDNAAVSVLRDIAGNSRIKSGTVDMGAYESPGKMYVDVSKTSAVNNNGSSWTNAYIDLQEALQGAGPKDTIWVAAGTYKPTTGTNRNISFQIPDSVKVFGGFAGNEASDYDLDLRDFNANETILSGNIGALNDSKDNTYNVIYTAGVSSATHVNGFTISDGYAADMNGERQRRGGGWYNDGTTAGASSPTISHCIFKSNIAQYGGGMYNNAGSSGGETKPLLWHCTFISNFAFRNDVNICDGGAVYNDGEAGDSSPILENCVFEDNYSKGTGDAIYNYVVNGKCSPVVNNCIFKNTIEFNNNNRATLVFFGNGDASAVFNNNLFTTEVNSMHISYDDGTVNKQPQFTNCTFYGASIRVIETNFDNGATPVDFTSCIFRDNNGDIASDNAHVNITYSIVEEAAFTQGPFSGNSNVNQDPLFVNAPAGNFRLNSNSPAKNTGDNGAVSVLRDIAGNSRIKSGTVDMGAYESPGKMYVDVSKTSAVNNNGSSWLNAYTDLQDALQGASPDDTIWVAAGTYKPTTGTDRSISFQIPDSVKVFGGFAGNEVSDYNLDLRNFTTNETILSGDIGTQNDNADNAYHVVFTKNVSSETVVDGVTITKGNANVSLFPNSSGGGWFNDGAGTGNSSNPSLTNCTFTSNTALADGGAMYNNGYGGVSSPILTNCVFTVNYADDDGGAMCNQGDNGVSSPILTNCLFTDNYADDDGGAMFNIGEDGVSSPILTNCVFTDNYADDDGGAIYNDGFDGVSSPVLTNCTFAINTANSSGGAMFNNGFEGISSPTLTNCILWGNMANYIQNSFYNYDADVTISYSLVEEASCNALIVNSGGNVTCSGTMLYNQDPLFINASDPAGADNLLGTADDGLRLQNSSPAKNAGDNAAVSVLRDIAGNSRIKSGTVDMGAYESSGKMYVDVSKTSAVNNNGSSWLNAYTDLQDALQGAGPKDTIWVAAGTYKPTTGTDRSTFFQIPDSVQVFGGFAGNEASNYDLDLRDFTTNETILSGNIGALNFSTDNSYHVVYTKNVSPETVVDGITITKGNANDSSFPNDSGGGWFNDGSGNSSNPTMANCTFVSNTAGFGGAMCNDGSDGGTSNPTLTNCTFAINTAGSLGGALYNFGFNKGISNPTLINSTFASNTANRGGATYNNGEAGVSSPILINCTFISNTANIDGGAMYNYGDFGGDSNPTLTNCTFTSNMANDDGGAMFNYGSSGTSNPTLTNCTFTDNYADGGGAIYWFGDNGDISSSITNCLFSNNGDDHIGYDDGDPNTQPHFFNCTFYGALQISIDIDFFDSGQTPVDFSNCIFWDNNGDIASNNAHVNITHSIVEEAAFTLAPFASNNNLFVDPLFIDVSDPAGVDNVLGTADDGLRLQSNSPAIDQGSNAGIAHIEDITGQKHINAPDMGAYENPCSKIQTITSVAAITSSFSSSVAVLTLQANNIINPTSNVYYKAGNSILLQPGFEAKSGNVFEAEIGDGCN